MLTTISLILNVVAAFLLCRDSQRAVGAHERNSITRFPLDYDNLKNQWGKAWLGLDVADVSPEAAARAGLDRAEGAYVKAVATGSPAQKAGIAVGDVILSFNGRKLRTAMQFQSDLLASEVGSEVYMCVAKDDHRITVYAVPKERPSHLAPVSMILPYLGIEVAEVAFGTESARKLEEADKAGGVLVKKVVRNSPAEKAGLGEGDIIMSLNSRKTRTVRELLSDLAGAQAGESIRMCIMSDDYRKTIYVTLETSREI